MKAHVTAIKTALEALDRVAYYLVVPGAPAYPYYLFEIVRGGRPVDMAVDGASTDVDVTVRVKAVSPVPEVALDELDRARVALVPNGRTARLAVEDRVAWLTFERHEGDWTDDGVTLPGVSAHPAVSLDSYRLVSTPSDDDGS